MNVQQYTQSIIDNVKAKVDELFTETRQQKELIADLVGDLEYIREYWNGDNNEQAMVDALEHINAIATEAISRAAQDMENDNGIPTTPTI